MIYCGMPNSIKFVPRYVQFHIFNSELHTIESLHLCSGECLPIQVTNKNKCVGISQIFEHESFK